MSFESEISDSFKKNLDPKMLSDWEMIYQIQLESLPVPTAGS